MHDDMVERVAMSIAGTISGREKVTPWSRSAARAAIEAMREPNEAMLDVGFDMSGSSFGIGRIWQAMIDAALTQKDAAEQQPSPSEDKTSYAIGWNDGYDAACVAPARDAIARLVEPEAFLEETLHQQRVYKNETMKAAREQAFHKADAILGTLDPDPYKLGKEWCPDCHHDDGAHDASCKYATQKDASNAR